MSVSLYGAATEALIAGPVIPDLYEPVLLGFSPLAFQVRGIERVGLPGSASASFRSGIASCRDASWPPTY
jgi:hypothetical protein